MKADYMQRVQKAAAAIPAKFRPQTAVILGSGLSGIVSGLGYEELPYASIPEFPQPTVHGHKSTLYLSERNAIMAGRFHYYEGHPMDNVVLPIFILHAIGVRNLILTNAAGAVNRNYKPGDLVLIKDHINLMGTNPFIGPNPSYADGSTPGQRFFDAGSIYTPELRKLAQANSSHPLHEGVYTAFTGPSYETPAEIRMVGAMGGDLVGMSTVPEAIAARYLGMRVLGISCATNMAAGISDETLDHAEVLEVGKRAEAELKQLILKILEQL
ncbi:MAG: purine-nucleoside phosphorylase [Spirochaetes bacterium]|nr:purine-nucleoside phosphorylase [Spirochaetota bacterium]MBU0955421.1 purine-nucleoside phosphorylase [Spirochaetota bacterium]